MKISSVPRTARRTHVVLIGLVLGLAAPADPAAAEPITWRAAVEEAAQNHPELRAARETVRAAEYEERVARSGFLPQVSGNVTYTDADIGSTTLNTTPQYAASVSVTQNLFAGFRDQAAVARASANREVSGISLEIAKARVSFELKAAFAALRFAQDNGRLAEDIVRRREENLRVVELRFESGRENRGSYLLSRARLEEARFERLQAQQAVTLARQQLARALGRTEPAEFVLVDDVPVQPPAPQVDIHGLALRTPDYRQAAAQERAAEAGIAIARAALLPSVNLTGSVARRGDSWYPGENVNSVGVSLSVPLYSGGRNYFGMQSAVASHAAASANRESVERQLLIRLRDAHNRYIQAVEKLRVDEELVAAAATRAEIARHRYDNGLMSFEDWDFIENDLVARQKTVLASRRERINAEAAWEQAQGTGVIP